MSEPTTEELEKQVAETLELENALAKMESELAPELREFLIRQKETQQQIANFWKNVEKGMIEHNIKSIKGDWGSITIVERLGWDISPLLELPAKFYKKVPDLKKMTDYFRLEGKAPKGAKPKHTKFLRKDIKGREIE
jgi:hypothetical protein